MILPTKNKGRTIIHDLRHLQVFVEAANSRSFTEAAVRLGVSAASVSRTIAHLEQALDVRLFNRSTRHIHLTDDGQTYLCGVNKALAQLSHAQEEVREHHRRVAGPLKVVLPNTFTKNYLMPELHKFTSLYPELKLELNVTDYGVDLLGGKFDVGLQYGEPVGANYIVRSLGRNPIILAASCEYLERRGVPQTIADLDDHHRLCFGPSSSEPFTWQIFRRDSVNRQPVVEHVPQGPLYVVGHLDTAVLAAANGYGITPVDAGAAMRFLKSGELKVVLPDYEVLCADLFLLYPHREHLPTRVRVFIDFIIDVANRRMMPAGFDPHDYAASPRSSNAPVRELTSVLGNPHVADHLQAQANGRTLSTLRELTIDS